MIDFFSWYLLVFFLNLLIFPLVYSLFPGLEDRGYGLARVAGLLLWGYLFWMLATLGVAQNDLGGLTLALILVAIAGLWSGKKNLLGIKTWLKHHLSMVLVVEAIFLIAFAILAVVRSANPDITGTEKPMELAFINAILNSPTFPPRDPWLAGFSISYYYFGYLMTAMLSRMTDVSGGVAFNLMLSLTFALSAVGAYGLVYNLVSSRKKYGQGASQTSNSILPIFGTVFLLITSNFEGFLEVLHRKGFFWNTTTDGTMVSRFWSWLDIKDLVQAPLQKTAWIPDRFWWWWRASRVVSDTTLAGAPQELIDEFPVFSFLLGDLHPHVLSIPYILLALGLALNIYLGGWHGQTRIAGFTIPIKLQGLLVTPLVLGGLAFLNTWDILVAAAVIFGSYLIQRILDKGWQWDRLVEVFYFAAIVVVGSLLLYLPFFLHFSSQAGGILPNLVNPTRGAHLWIMFGPLFFPIFAYLLYALIKHRKEVNWKAAILIMVGVVIALWAISWLLALLIAWRMPETAGAFLQNQGVPDFLTLFKVAANRRLLFSGGLLSLMLIAIGSLAIILGRFAIRHKELKTRQVDDADESDIRFYQPVGYGFVALLFLLGSLLVLAPDFVYLRDQFGWRINTIFKFYYQAWILWSIAAGYSVAVLLTDLKRIWKWLAGAMLIVVFIMAGTYTVISVSTKTNHFDPYLGWSLDGTAYLSASDPDEAEAIAWLKEASDGFVVEAVGGSYSTYARVSTMTGKPTILGWPGHESQWRGGMSPQGTRAKDIQSLYETSSWDEADAILSKYAIRYVYIGFLEKSTYQVNESKFVRHLVLAYQRGSVSIYEVP
jgi:YYY domain-containing protein